MTGQNKKLVVGLTGGIGSGKSLVADEFARLGISVVDTDAIAHELTAPDGAAIEDIAQAFGNAAIDNNGSLNRAWMRERVFKDPAERTRLEAILHPMIRDVTNGRVAAATSAYVIMAVPLLIESGNWQQRVDRVLVVDCEVQTQIDRVMIRSQLSAAQVQAIIDVQATREQRLAAADDIIDNDGDKSVALSRTRELHKTYLGLSGQAQ